MKNLTLPIISFLAIAICLGCSDEKEGTEMGAKRQATSVARAPQPGFFIVNNTHNNGGARLNISSVMAQASATQKITHKDLNFYTVSSQKALKLHDYENISPENVITWWTVDDSVNPSQSGTFPASTIQSIYGPPTWCGIYVTAITNSGIPMFSSGNYGFKNTLGDVSLGNYNTSITFSGGGVTCHAKYFVDSYGNSWVIVDY